MVEVNHREHNPQLLSQFEEDPQQRNRVCSPRNWYSHALAGPYQPALPKVLQYTLCQFMHSSMVQPGCILTEWLLCQPARSQVRQPVISYLRFRRMVQGSTEHRLV